MQTRGLVSEKCVFPKVEVIVGRVRPDKGYIACYPIKDQPIGLNESITCSLNNWQDNNLPEKGQRAVALTVRMFAQGWRAKAMRPSM